jgi:ADP-ribosylglycohydrolase
MDERGTTFIEATIDSAEDRLFSPVAGCLIGGAAADALGWITEFVRGRDHLQKVYRTTEVTEYRPWQKTTSGRFNAYIDYISRGEYSDDTQLSLSVARSLNADGSVDIDHFSKKEIPLWLAYARGGGSTMTAAARSLKKKATTWDCNFFSYRHRGHDTGYRQAGANGAAMRVAPIALANVNDPEQMSLAVWKTSICTHGHPRAIFGALLFAEAVRYCAHHGPSSTGSLLEHLTTQSQKAEIPQSPEFAAWLQRWNEEGDFSQAWTVTKDEVLSGLLTIASPEFQGDPQRVMEKLGCFKPESKGSGTGTVLAALAIYGALGSDFRKAILFAVNALGSDTDTIAAFVGALCGVTHGYDEVPQEWATVVQDYDYFMRVATELTMIACRTGIGGQALLPGKAEDRSDVSELTDLLSKHDLDNGQRVYHPLFGTGWVKSVEAQRLRRKDGATVMLAWVAFDIGQSCKFRYMTIPGADRGASITPPSRPSPPPSLF